MKELAELIYKFFVINNNAIGLQQEDGTYRTKYISFDSTIIEKVLEKEESIMIYQQRLGTDFVKWVCLDFDCKDEIYIADLIKNYVKIATNYLDSLSINYTLEFSGRRGIHVWIFFDRLINKSLAFQVVNKISATVQNEIGFNEVFKLDLFPKTDLSKSKRVGAGVKLPLSKHKKSKKYSRFISTIDNTSELEATFELDEKNIKCQIDLLKNIKLNSVTEIVDKLEIQTMQDGKYTLYKKQDAYLDSELGLEDILLTLRKCKGYDDLFNRLLNGGTVTDDDRYLLLGTFGHLKPNGMKYLMVLLNYFPNFSPSISIDRINELKGYYYPPTLEHVHKILGVESCNCSNNLNRSVVEYICENSDLNIEIEDEIFTEDLLKNQKEFIKLITKKEYNYMLYNDEVVDIKIKDEMERLSIIHILQIEDIIAKIEDGEDITLNCEPIIYTREEESGKIRFMVVLNTMERIITSVLAMKLSLITTNKYDSYSYNTTPYFGKDLFYSWAKSWKLWTNRIDTYLGLDLFEDYQLLKIDIKSFYDSIFMSHVIDSIKEHFSKSDKWDVRVENTLDFLIKYNEDIMKRVNGGVRGVPQGPAYARIIAEMYLFMTFVDLRSKYDNLVWLRYVDDMYIFAPPSFDLNNVKNEILERLSLLSLEVNKDKTKIVDKLKNLTEVEKLEMNNFYALRSLFVDRDVKNADFDNEVLDLYMDRIQEFLFRDDGFSINDLNFLLSESINDKIRFELITHYAENIFGSRIGRGSLFSKLYNFIFSDDDLRKWFLQSQVYKYIPINTINCYTFLSVLFLYFSENQDFLMYELISEFLNYASEEYENGFDQKCKTMQAILDREISLFKEKLDD